MPASLKLMAPAKLNLFLHITGRRPDGYHELQTLFQLLDYGDELEFALEQGGLLAFHTRPADFPVQIPTEQNLVLRSVDALAPLRPDPDLGISITLTKRIPLGGGLGGGSSDAATTLLALNQLWQLGLSRGRLAEIGLGLGADVPVFVHGHSAWAEGVGEKLQPVKLPARWYLVVAPDCAVDTGAVFARENLTRNSPAIKIADFLADGARNDCEPVTRALYPEVDDTLKYLTRFGQPRMSGTGASVFLDFPDEASARTVQHELPAAMESFVAQGIGKLEQQGLDA